MEEKANRNMDRTEIFSKAVRAGKRTYFFDVKQTISNEYYLTITESKRRFNNDQGKFYYEKHKLFLYKEDFDKFSDGLAEVIQFIKTEQPYDPSQDQYHKPDDERPSEVSNKHTDISFEDLKSDSEED
jgi:hypothetical protein